MSKIEELIQQYCPDGVKYVHLGDVMSISRGSSPRPIQNYLTDDKNGIPWIKIGDATSNSKYITSTKERITKEGATKSRYLKRGSFILSNSMSFGKPFILDIEGCIHDGWISMCDYGEYLNSDFLYYLLRSNVVQSFWISKANSGGAVANLNSDIVRSTPIPLPPLPVQEEIANLLDIFTELQAELQAQLQAELEVRKKQQEYFKYKLFDFQVPCYKTTMDAICQFVSVGIATSATHAYKDIGVPMFRNQNIKENYLDDSELLYISDEFEQGFKNKRLQENDILVTRTGYPGIACVVPKKYENAQTFTTLIARPNKTQEVLPKYICCYINSPKGKEYVELKKTGAAQQNFGAKELAKMPIEIPPLLEQKRIISSFERIDTITSHLTETLSAEIEKRMQQYEFYRDKLLTFKRKEA